MSGSEQDRVREILLDGEHGRESGRQLRFNSETGRITAVGGNDPDARHLNVAHQNFGFSVGMER